MRRLGLVVVLIFLGGLLLGLAVEEKTGVASRIDDAVKVQLTGRLPLEDWEPTYPTAFNPVMDYWVHNLPTEGEWGVTWLSHSVGRDGEGVAAKALELELLWYEIAVGDNFCLRVIVFYADGEGYAEKTFSAQELLAEEEASEDWPITKLTVPLDPEHSVYSVDLRGNYVLPPVWLVRIKRAELILR